MQAIEAEMNEITSEERIEKLEEEVKELRYEVLIMSSYYSKIES